MTTAGASPHVTRATKRLIAKGWLRDLTHIGHGWVEGRMVDRYIAPSEQEGHEPYLVLIAVGSDWSRCECQGHTHLCKHVATCRELQSRISNTIRGVEAQLALEAVYR